MKRRRARREAAPTFTLITALYRSAAYLPTFLASVDALDGGLDDVEMLFVDDGSPDDSAALAEAWIAATGAPARVVRKEHGGSVSARNRGLDLARGDWVSFPDPDDALDPGYLSAIRRFLASDLARNDPPHALAAKVVQFTDAVDAAVDDHVLGYRYHSGPGCVHLAAQPEYFHTHAPSGFFRRELVERAHLRLDPRLYAGFEDAAFDATYLLQVPDPVVGYVPEAVYAYRRRPDSVVGTMWSKPARYAPVVEHGYLPLLQARDPVPRWVELLVLYDLWCYFAEYEQPGSPSRSMGADVERDFLAALDAVLRHLSESAVTDYALHPIPRLRRAAVLARMTGRTPTIARAASDGGLTHLSYLTLPGGPGPGHAVASVDGTVRTPVTTSSRTVDYYGTTFVEEHELALDAAGEITFTVAGTEYAVTPAPPRPSPAGSP